MKTSTMLLGILALGVPAIANAQAYKCDLPRTFARPKPDRPTADQPKRLRAIGGYTLAITWAPQFCHDNARDASARFECGSGNRFGFTLHGLWPDGKTREWPQYCRPTRLLSKRVLSQHMCATPNLQLIQHEWAKHGTCTRDSPSEFFERSRTLYARLRYPDMDALSRRTLTAGDFAKAMATANPGLDADMMRITANENGWLEEVWFCLDLAYRYHRCPSFQGGLPDDARIRIWRGPR